MDLEKLKVPFTEAELEYRLAQCGEGKDGKIWAQFLVYITSRAIMDRLDGVCGPENWKVTYDFIGTTGVICNLSILCGGEWITKQDGAEMTNIEAFKGGISSALKRAGSAWGMGRYLYSLDAGFADVVKDKNIKGAQYGKTKSGTVFYWVPKELPEWALPKKIIRKDLKTIMEKSKWKGAEVRNFVTKNFPPKTLVKELNENEFANLCHAIESSPMD